LIFIISGAIILLISVAFIIRSNTGPSISPPRLGQKMSDFQLKSLDGKTVRLSDYIGKVVLINTWATWCPPCRAEMPDLAAFYTANRDNNFIILAINAGESSTTAAAFVNELGLTFPVLLDPDYRLMDSLGIDSFPTSILVGADGIIKHIQLGMFMPGELDNDITPFLQQ
jgi:peroxiredoxin